MTKWTRLAGAIVGVVVVAMVQGVGCTSSDREGSDVDTEPYNFELDGPTATAQSALSSPDLISRGVDCFRTDGASPTQFDFSGEWTLPAGFFAPGSAPFGEMMNFVHRGPYTDDTCMKRYNDMDFTGQPVGTVLTTPIRLRKLNLLGAAPIVVLVNGVPTYWQVRADLSPKVWSADNLGNSTPDSPPVGQMTVRKEDDNGGSYDATFQVRPSFTFQQCADPACNAFHPDWKVRVFDTVTAGLAPDTLEVEAVPWVKSSALSPETKYMLCAGNDPRYQYWCKTSSFQASFCRPPPPPNNCIPNVPQCVAVGSHEAKNKVRKHHIRRGTVPDPVCACGDGIKTGAEECDGCNFGFSSCQTHGFDDGQLHCTANCKIDNSQCFNN